MRFHFVLLPLVLATAIVFAYVAGRNAENETILRQELLTTQAQNKKHQEAIAPLQEAEKTAASRQQEMATALDQAASRIKELDAALAQAREQAAAHLTRVEECTTLLDQAVHERDVVTLERDGLLDKVTALQTELASMAQAVQQDATPIASDAAHLPESAPAPVAPQMKSASPSAPSPNTEAP